jgi:hypothetical protein
MGKMSLNGKPIFHAARDKEIGSLFRFPVMDFP